MEKIIIAKNTTYQAIGKVITSGVGFLITILIARFFGKEGYGDFIKITTFVGIFYLGVDLGLNAFFLKLDKEKNRFSDLIFLRLIIAISLVIICILIVLFLPFDMTTQVGFPIFVKEGIFIFSLTIISQAVFLSTGAIFQRSHRYDLSTKALAITSILNLMLIGIGVYFSWSLLLIIGAFVVSNAFGSIISILLTKESIHFALDKTFQKTLLLSSLPLGAMLIFNLIYFQADIFILSIFKSSQEVGIYGLSGKFFDFLLAIPLFLSNSIYPFLLKAEGKDFWLLFKKYIFVFIFLSLIIAVPFWFLSPLFTIIKKDFTGAIVPFRILLLSLPIFFLTNFFQWIFISLGRQKFLLVVYALSTILNIALNIFFIPLYGYIASAVLTVACETIVLIVFGVNIYATSKK